MNLPLENADESQINEVTQSFENSEPPPEKTIGTLSTVPMAAELPSIEVGQQVGPYVVIEKLGGGSQSVVWRAVQLEPQPREVALKVFGTSCSFERLEPVARLRKEAGEGGRLAGTAILSIYDCGEADGYFFFAGPLIDGFALSDVLDQRRRYLRGQTPTDVHPLAALAEELYPLAVVRVLARIALALAASHAAGLAHCDVKPSNILLDREHEDSVFLTDFEVGRSIETKVSGSAFHATGTPLYMSREKLLGLDRIDEVRCDVFALGVTLFEAVTLVRPFDIPEEVPEAEWATYLTGLEPLRPGAVRSSVSQALEAIIMKAMARDPERRYPSATALADDLARFLARDNVLSHQDAAEGADRPCAFKGPASP